MRGPADRAAEVGADSERGTMACDGGGLAAARAADGHRSLRILCLAEERVVGVAEHRELGAVRLAEEDRAGGAKAGDGGCILGWNEVLQEGRAGGQGKPCRCNHVLDG